MNINKICDNVFNRSANYAESQYGSFNVIQNLQNAPLERAPATKELALGGEMLFRKVLVNPVNQQTANVDLYVKGFLKPLRLSFDIRIRAIVWDRADKELDARGKSVEEAYNKIVEKVFEEIGSAV